MSLEELTRFLQENQVSIERIPDTYLEEHEWALLRYTTPSVTIDIPVDDEYQDADGSQELKLVLILLTLDSFHENEEQWCKENFFDDDKVWQKLNALSLTLPLELPFSYLDWQLNAGLAQELRRLN